MGMIEKFVVTCMSATQPAAFTNMDPTTMSANAIIVLLITMIVYLVLILLIGKYLFNEVFTKLFPMVKPATSVFQILGLVILAHLILPSA